MHDTHEHKPVNIDEQALQFAEEVRDAETRLLASGWCNPARLYAAALEYGIGGASFVDPIRSFVFACICVGYENDHMITIPDVVKLARMNNFPLPNEPYHRLRELRLTEVIDSGIEAWAKLVAENGQRRERAREHIRAAHDLLADQPWPLDVPEPTRRTLRVVA